MFSKIKLYSDVNLFLYLLFFSIYILLVKFLPQISIFGLLFLFYYSANYFVRLEKNLQNFLLFAFLIPFVCGIFIVNWVGAIYLVSIHISSWFFSSFEDKKFYLIISMISLVIFVALLITSNEFLYYYVNKAEYSKVLSELQESFNKNINSITPNFQNNNFITKDFIIKKLIPFFLKIFFFSTFIQNFVLYFIIFYFLNSSFFKKRLFIKNYLTIDNIVLDKFWMLVLIFSLVVQIFFKGKIFVIGLNLMLIVLAIYIFYGTVIVLSGIKNLKNNIFILLFIIFSLLFLGPFLLLFLMLVGILDYFFDWKQKISRLTL